MKVQITFKTPDAVEYAANSAVEFIEDADERDEARLHIADAISKWVEHGECVRIEVDSETGEARVLPVK